MTSCNGNIFRVTGPLGGEITGQWRGDLMFSLICAWTNGWVNNRDAGDFRRHWVRYEVTVMDAQHIGSLGVISQIVIVLSASSRALI